MSSQIKGNLQVAEDVLADIVGNAAMECYGVVGVCAPNAADGIAKILPASRLRRGVVISRQDEGVFVDLYIIVEYGTNIATVSQNLIDQVTYALKEYTRVPLVGVDVHVMDVKVRR
jgi:uncharacterized alkaline shock family protein YloU